MPKLKIIRSTTGLDKSVSPLTRLTMFFHQDTALLDCDPLQLGADFVAGLSDAERRRFKASVIKLLEDYPGRDQKGLKNAWRRLGAQSSLEGLDLRHALKTWAGIEP